MPRRSTLQALPETVLDELRGRLVAGGFADYEGLTRWLNGALGAVTVSRSAVHRFGQEFQAEFEAHMAESRVMYNVAKAAVEADEDPEGVLQEATTRALQSGLLRLSVTIRKLQDSEDPKEIAKLLSTVARATADLGRTNITQKKWQAEYEDKHKAKLDALESEAKQGKRPIDLETLAIIRRETYGLSP